MLRVNEGRIGGGGSSACQRDQPAAHLAKEAGSWAGGLIKKGSAEDVDRYEKERGAIFKAKGLPPPEPYVRMVSRGWAGEGGGATYDT